MANKANEKQKNKVITYVTVRVVFEMDKEISADEEITQENVSDFITNSDYNFHYNSSVAKITETEIVEAEVSRVESADGKELIFANSPKYVIR